MFKTVWKIYVDFEKEEKWINEMAQEGWLLERYFFLKYTFKKGEPGAYHYRIELLENLAGSKESLQYFSFLQDANIEVVSTYYRWVYLRKPAKEGPFELFTDIKSRIAHYKRILTLVGIGCGINLYFGFSNLLHVKPEENLFFTIADSIYYVNLILGLLLLPYVLYLVEKIRQLKKEQLLRE